MGRDVNFMERSMAVTEQHEGSSSALPAVSGLAYPCNQRSMTLSTQKFFNIYCDESCHLENDGQGVMVLGALICPTVERRRISEAVWALKRKHRLAKIFEAKWTKVSPAQLTFYSDLVQLFFDEPKLRFRAVVIPDKALLDHARFSQTHDEFYYKMYYRLLTALLENGARFRIYLDIKDTRGQQKVERLHEVLCNAHLDFDREVLQTIQQVRSHEVELLQIADILIGALSYSFRGLSTSPAKLAIIEQIKQRSGLKLTQSTLLYAKKFNLLVWESQEANAAS